MIGNVGSRLVVVQFRKRSISSSGEEGGKEGSLEGEHGDDGLSLTVRLAKRSCRKIVCGKLVDRQKPPSVNFYWPFMMDRA